MPKTPVECPGKHWSGWQGGAPYFEAPGSETQNRKNHSRDGGMGAGRYGIATRQGRQGAQIKRSLTQKVLRRILSADGKAGAFAKFLTPTVPPQFDADGKVCVTMHSWYRTLRLRLCIVKYASVQWRLGQITLGRQGTSSESSCERYHRRKCRP